MNGSSLQSRRVLSARRIALLATTVAGIGAAAFLFAPIGHPFGTAAQAQNLTEKVQQLPQHPVGFADIVEKVKPAVMSVRVKIDRPADTNLSDEDLPFPPGSPFERFFKRFGAPNMPNNPGGHEVITGQGSGFFISRDGYAVTNNHVVQNAENVQVTTDDGKIYSAKVIGTDTRTDLALIKIDGNDFPFVKLADSPPRIGDWVLAVGNPFGLGGTVTAGIVSARGRDIGAGPYDDYVQIDAPINKGNSGGPAFDVDGNVIGVNTAIYSPSGGSVGIGFDIPADTAKLVVAQLQKSGHVTRGWLGVQIQPVTASIADSLGMKKAEGAMVDAPQNGSPAAKAGIEAGDVITAVNGTPVKDARDLARTIATMAPDSSAKLDIIRQGEPKTISLTLAQMPNDQQQAKADGDNAQPTRGVPHLGLQVAPASEVSGAGGQGVVVTAVDPDGPAAEQGFQTGTVILDVGGNAVANAGDVRTAMTAAKAQGKHDVLMRVKMGDATRFVAMPLGDA